MANRNPRANAIFASKAAGGNVRAGRSGRSWSG